MKLKENHEKMLETIISHPEYGIKNPIDIGVNCGYAEAELLEMVRELRDSPKSDEPRIIYFVVKPNRDLYNQEDYRVIVSIDTMTLEVKIVKKLEGLGEAENIKIKKNIFAYVDDEDRIVWENLETGQKGEINIYNFMYYDTLEYEIMKEGIIFSHNGTIRMMKFDGNYSAEVEGSIGYGSIVLEDSSGINIIGTTSVKRIDRNFTDREVIYRSDSDGVVAAAGCEAGKVFFYTVTCENCYNKICAETGQKTEVQVEHNAINTSLGVQNMIITDNYKLSGYGVIESKTEISKALCPWIKLIRGEMGNQLEEIYTQVVGIPSRDLIFGNENDSRRGSTKYQSLFMIDLANNSKRYLTIPWDEVS